MNGIARLMSMLLLSVIIAVSLSLISDLGGEEEDGLLETAGYDMESDTVLTNENLVDYISRIPIHHKLDKVEWDGALLTVDLKIEEELQQPEEIYDDLFVLSRFGFAHTLNVQNLLVRVMYPENGQNRPTWLIAMKASREQWKTEEAEQVISLDTSPEVYLQNRFQLQYSQVWNNTEPL